MAALQIEHNVKRDRRFELVKIAFEKVLFANQADLLYVERHSMIGHKAVSLADAVLAEMDKEPTTEPDTNEKGTP